MDGWKYGRNNAGPKGSRWLDKIGATCCTLIITPRGTAKEEEECTGIHNVGETEFDNREDAYPFTIMTRGK